MNDTIFWFASIAKCKRRRRWLLGALAISLSGCRSLAPTTTPVRNWPAPPERARVAFVGAVNAPRDLGFAPAFWQKTLNVLTGGDRGAEPWIAPFGIWLGDDGDLCFTDTARGEVVWADGARHHLRRWDHIGTNSLLAPVSVACSAGRLYIADSGLGRVLIADWQGRSLGELAHGFRRPVAVAAGAGRLYVADAEACCVQVFTASGQWLQTIGRGGTGAGEFNHPSHLATDTRGWLYVADTLNNRVQVFDAAGTFVRAIGGPGDSSGHFGRPKGVAVDRAGHVLVVDGLFGVVQIFDADGAFLLDFGEPGQEAGQFWLPAGIAVNAKGQVAVADVYNHRLQCFQLLTDAPGPTAVPAMGGPP